MTASSATPRPFLIGLAGAAGVGKTTLAKAIMRAAPSPVVILGTAGPLKAMMRTLYRAHGLAAAEVDRRLDGDLKRTPDPILGGRTPTEAMQALGTEWGREMVAPCLWVRSFEIAARHCLHDGESVVNDSVRFANEVAAIRVMGGQVVRLVSSTRGDYVGAHRSEDPPPADFVLLADDPPEVLAARVLERVR